MCREQCVCAQAAPLRHTQGDRARAFCLSPSLIQSGPVHESVHGPTRNTCPLCHSGTLPSVETAAPSDGARRLQETAAGDCGSERREQAARRGAATRATDEAAATRRREGAAAGGDGWSAEAGGGGWRGREDAGARRRREDAAVGRGGRRHREKTDDLQTRHPCICEDRR